MTNNSIIIGVTVARKPKMIADAEDFENRIFEMKVKRTRLSGSKSDEFVVLFSGRAAPENLFLKMDCGLKIKLYGELRNKGLVTSSKENQTHILAEKIVKCSSQKDNSVRLCGMVCTEPLKYITENGTNTARFKLRVKSGGYFHYIPCTAWRENGTAAAGFKPGDYICIKGTAQSREYITRDTDGAMPRVKIAYEVAVNGIEQYSGKRKEGMDE